MIYEEDLQRVRDEIGETRITGYIAVLERELREVKSENHRLREGIKEIISKCQIIQPGSGS